MTICGVYTITNTANGKQYVGQSLDILQRWRQHRHRLDEGTHLNAHLQAAWNLHGADTFLFQVLCLCEPDDLGAAEETLLADVPPDLRYNIGPAGDNPTRGLTHGEDVRANMSRAKGGKPVVATNKETGEEQRFPYLQRAVEELGLAQSHAWACCHGKRASTGGWRVRFDEEHVPSVVQPKEKKPKRPDRRSREIVGTHVTSGEEIHFSRVAAVREQGFLRESVIKCLSGQMQTHKGYRWHYADGKPHETLDAAWKAKMQKPRSRGSTVSRPIRGTHIDTGEVLIFSYIAEAARQIGTAGPHISHCLAGRIAEVKGYKWEYVDGLPPAQRIKKKKEGP